jgi:cell division protein FtsL
MAVEYQRFSRRFAGAGYASSGRMGVGFRRQAASVSREAGVWLVGALIGCAPFIVYGVGQHRHAAAQAENQRLQGMIQQTRLDITDLRRRLRRELSPSVLTGWANKNGMEATNDTVRIAPKIASRKL